ncbi:hypothetical protein M8J76_015516 [Diaphorina citri]|nr:hypothetical protein M8J75_001129 [Diaphorina citri]KAI5741626.1 hypothetical protein M8J76_015516 [Diaphorina citri]
MKICLILSLAVFLNHAVTCQRQFYISDTRYTPKNRYRVGQGRGEHRRSLSSLPEPQYPSDPFDPTYPMGTYPVGKEYPGFPKVQRLPVHTTQDLHYPGDQVLYPSQSLGYKQSPYDIPQRRAFQESPYPSFQAFEDAYPAFSPTRQTLQGHPYHSQRIRIKHSFPADKHVDAASPQLNQYIPDFADTPHLNRLLPNFGGARLGGGQMSDAAHLTQFLPGYGGGRNLAAQMVDPALVNHLLPGYGGANKLAGQIGDSAPQMRKLLPQYDAMDSRMMQYAQQPNTIVVEKKVPMPYKVQIEKPYFVEVTKHIAVPVAVPVPKPMPYPVHKYIQIPKYIQVPQSSVDHTGGTQERSTTASLSPRPTRPPSPPSYSTTPHPYSFDYPYYTPEHLPQVSIHPNGVSPSPTPSQDYMLQLLEQKSHQGALTLEELQQLMQSEKLPDDPFIIKK